MKENRNITLNLDKKKKKKDFKLLLFCLAESNFMAVLWYNKNVNFRKKRTHVSTYNLKNVFL